MKVVLLMRCIVESPGCEPVMLIAGDTIDVADSHANAAIKRGLAEPFVNEDDAASNTPGREKASMRRSPEYH